MRLLFRVLLSSVAVVAAYCFTLLPRVLLISLTGQGWIRGFAEIVSLLCAVGAGWYAWRRTRSLAGNVGDAAASSPAASIAFWALIIGGVSFAAGFYGPIFLSTSNLGPLLGIFVTGPVGTLAGALWGIVSSAKNATALATRPILAWLAAVSMLTMLDTLFMIDISRLAVLVAIGLQGLIVISSAFLLYRGNTRTRLSEPVHRCQPVAITTLALIMLVTVFPPVTRPWWGRAQESADPAAPLPKVAFILDGRFDASRHIPLFAVDRPVLVLEWVMAAVAGLAVSLVMIRARGRSRPDIGPPGAA